MILITSMRARVTLVASAGILALSFAWAFLPKQHVEEIVLQFPTDYGEAQVRRVGSDLRLDLHHESLALPQTDSAQLLRINDTGGFYLLRLERAAGSCATSLIYLMLTDGEIAFSEEFGNCLSDIEAFEDWTGIFVKGRTPEGEANLYRLHHTGAVRMVPAP